MDYQNNNPDRELGWDDPIEHEEREFVLFPAGDYPFQIINLEKARHDNPNSKTPPCPKAILTVRVTEPATGRTADMTCNLLLHSSWEWKLCEFFAAIGLRRKGESKPMEWGRVVGSRGYLNLSVREYTRRDGDIGKSNDIKRFYPADEAPLAGSAPAAPAYQPAPAPVYQPAPAYQPPQTCPPAAPAAAPGGWNPR